MGRLIDADALKRVLVVEWNLHDSDEFANKDVWKALELAPTIHPEPPKIGKWVEDVAYYAEDGCPCIITRCDQCGEPNPVSKFCPNCGAKMEDKE